MNRLMVIALSLLFIETSPLKAAALDYVLGEQDFTNQQTPILASETRAAGVGEPFPFDGTIFGDDTLVGRFGDATYVHTGLSIAGQTPVLGQLTIGIIDHDSFISASDSLDVFFDGAQQDDLPFRGISFAPSSASVVTLPVPPALLQDGELTIRFVSRAVQGQQGNSFGLDFSRLRIQYIPEPCSLSLLVVVAVVIAYSGSHRRRTFAIPRTALTS